MNHNTNVSLLTSSDSESLTKRIGAYFLSVLLVFQPALGLAADPVAANGSTTVYKAENGVAVVDIARANAAGLSHNKFDSYDVDTRGLVLNNGNSAELIRQSQLAGQVAANLNLASQARVILNEVVSPNRSQLNGYTEVLGGAADVIVANPYGISCNGCGFINTPNVTLTTGLPQLDGSGRLSGFQVNSGDIVIGGSGINASSADVLSLVTPALKLQGQVNAKELSVSVGQHRWNYLTREATDAVDSGESFGLDSSALGGMYANRIRIQASGAGVGVKMLGDAASAGEFTIDAQGQVVLKNQLSAEKNININTTSTASNALQMVDASVSTKANLNLTAAGGAELVGGALVAKNIDINADSLSDVASTASSADNNKRHADTVAITTAGDVDLNGTSWSSKNSLNINADSLKTHASSVSSDGTMSLRTAGDMNLGQASVSSTGDVTLASGGSVSTQAGANQGVQITEGNIAIMAETGVVNAGVITADKGNAVVRSNGVINNSGTLHADQALDIADKNNGTTAQISNAGNLLSGGSLSAKADSLNNTGAVQAETQLDLEVANDLSNDGTVLSTGSLSAKADSTANTGTVQAGTQLSLEAVASVANTGDILSAGELSAKANSLNNTGTLQAETQLGLEVAGDINNDGTVLSAGALSAKAESITNSGTVQAETQLTVEAVAGITNTESLLSAGSLNINANSITNSGTVKAGAQLIAEAVTSITNAGSIWSDGQLTANADNIAINSDAVIRGNTVNMEVGQFRIDNHGALNSMGDTSLNIQQLLFGGDKSRIVTAINGGTTNINLASVFTNVGAIHSGGDLNLNLPALINTNTGGISALGALAIHAAAGDIYNAGALYAGQQLNASTTRKLINYNGIGSERSGGTIDSSGSIDISADTFINHSRIDATQNITISADEFYNEVAGGLTIVWDSFLPTAEAEPEYKYYYSFPDGYEEWTYKSHKERYQVYENGLPKFTPHVIGSGVVTIKDFSVANNTGANISGNTVNLLGKVNSTFTNDSGALHKETHNHEYVLQTRWVGPKTAIALQYEGHIKKKILETYNTTLPVFDSELSSGIYATTLLNSSQTDIVNKGSPLSGEGEAPEMPEISSAPNSSVASSGSIKSLIGFPGLNLNLPTNPNGYYVATADPTSRYLVETNPLFSVGSNYLGSDYLTERLGYNPDEVQRRLGDAAYENSLIRQQLIEQTGRNILSGYDNEAAQVKGFLDAASEQFSDLNLELGKELSSVQISQLKSDIVWMVEKEVAGEKVLVPVVYLSQASIDGITSGAVIAAVDISMDLESLSNTGGTIVAENSMAIISEGDITNTGGSIQAEDMALVSTDGKIINETLVTRQGSDDNYQDVAGTTGSISAGNSMVLSGNQGIDIIGATVAAGGSATLHSENGDVNIESLALESKTTSNEYSSGLFNSSHKTTVETNQTALNAGVSAGGNLNIVAENGDVDLLGAELSSGEDLNIAGINVNSKALNLVSTKTVSETTSGITASGIGTASSSSSSYSSTGQGSTITAGNVMSINASNDIVLEGGEYNATAGVLNAGNNVTTIATKEVSNESSSSSFTGLSANGIGSESQSTTTNSTTHQNADLTFGDSLTITAGNTVDIGGMDATITNRAEPEPDMPPVDQAAAETEFVEATLPEEAPIEADPVEALIPGFDVAKLREAMADGDVGSYVEEVADNGMGFADSFAQPDENAVIGSLNISGDKVISTKFKDTSYTTSASSSTNVGFFSVDVENSTSEHATTADNINTLSAANVSINGTDSIDLKGVDIIGDDLIHLKSEGDITITAAEKQETFSATSHSTHVGFDGINVSSSSVEGMNKGHDDSKLSTEGLLSIESGGDVTFTGVTAEADTLGIQAENFTSAAYKDESTLKESSDTFAFGFSGIGQESKTLDINATQEVGNTIIANNALIDVKDNVTIVGGDVMANNLAINAHTVDIKAAESTWDEKKTQSGFALTAEGNAAFLGNRATASASSMGSAGSALGEVGKGFSALADSVNSAANVEPEAQVTSDVIAAASGNHMEGEDNVSHNGKAATGELVNAKAGLTISSSEETLNSTTYQNANLSFGNLTINTVGNSAEGDGHVDIGGANLVSLEGVQDSSINIRTGKLKTTKYVDDTKTTFKEDSLFVGVSTEGHSAIADVANHEEALKDKQNQGMELDQGLVDKQRAADASNVLMGDLAGSSVGYEISHTRSEASSHSTSENTNYIIAANINITTTEGDIDLNGVEFTAPPVFNNKTGQMEAGDRARPKTISLDSAKDVNLTAAKSTHSETSTTTSHTANLSLYSSASLTGSSVGIDAGYNGNTETTTLDSTQYKNTQLNADNVTIKGENLNMTGANVAGRNVKIDIENDINVTSVQDTQTKTTTRSNWGGSVGLSAGTTTLVAPSVSFQGGGGESRDNFKKTQQQSGIQAERDLDIAAGGGLTLTGANIGVAEGGSGRVDVKGDVVANQLNDVHDKSGGFYGGGGGFDAGGVNANIDIEVVDKIDQKITQNSTISGVDLTVGGEIKGDNLTSDGGLQTEQATRITDRKIAGVHIVSSAGGSKQGVKNTIKTATGLAKLAIASTVKSAEKLKQAATKLQKINPETEILIVTNKSKDQVVQQAVANRKSKKGQKLVIITENENGVLVDENGNNAEAALAEIKGKAKVGVVGHGSDLKGDGQHVAGLVNTVVNKIDANKHKKAKVDAVEIIACGTCNKESETTLGKEVAQSIDKHGVKVKEHNSSIEVRGDGNVVAYADRSKEKPTTSTHIRNERGVIIKNNKPERLITNEVLTAALVKDSRSPETKQKTQPKSKDQLPKAKKIPSAVRGRRSARLKEVRKNQLTFLGGESGSSEKYVGHYYTGVEHGITPYTVGGNGIVSVRNKIKGDIEEDLRQFVAAKDYQGKHLVSNVPDRVTNMLEAGFDGGKDIRVVTKDIEAGGKPVTIPMLSMGKVPGIRTGSEGTKESPAITGGLHSRRDDRGHLAMEANSKSDEVNKPSNVIAEQMVINQHYKKAFEEKAQQIAKENPTWNVVTVHEPISSAKDKDRIRPVRVRHYIAVKPIGMKKYTVVSAVTFKNSKHLLPSFNPDRESKGKSNDGYVYIPEEKTKLEDMADKKEKLKGMAEKETDDQKMDVEDDD